MTARLLVNPRFATEDYGAREEAVLSAADFARAKHTLRSWPEYAVTPLVERPDLAGRAGVARLAIKYEGARFAVGSFKALGPAYAATRLLQRVGSGVTLAAATSGNHGRAVAWAAREQGAACRVYMSEGVTEGRAQAIEGFGATVIRVPGTFDDALARCHAEAEAQGYYVVSDLVQPACPEVPAHTIHGYAMLGEELADQAADATHVFVGAGSGALAGAVAGRLWQRFGSARPRVVVVEPLSGDCVYRSAEAGRHSSTDGDLRTVMDGLAVGTPSTLGWTLLDRGAFAFLAIPDAPAIEAMQAAHRGQPSLRIGETGIAGLAGALVATEDDRMRRALGIDASSRVIAVACEGPTDPDLFQRLIGEAA
jgi:diaminopropionate ammonia-lyase